MMPQPHVGPFASRSIAAAADHLPYGLLAPSACSKLEVAFCSNNINNYKNSNDDKKQAHENCGEEKNGGAGSISDEDVECSADLVYKSGIKFKVSTR